MPPSGWHPEKGVQNVTISTQVGDTPGQYSERVSCDDPEEGKDYPRMKTVEFDQQEGNNLKMVVDQSSSTGISVTVKQISTGQQVEGQHNYAHVMWKGKDKANQDENWTLTVESDVC